MKIKIKFLGAAGTVTGSSHLLTASGGEKVLIDLGMYQGSDPTFIEKNKVLTFDPKSLHAALLTHAHLDHCGRLPLLPYNGFTGPVYMTEATRAILEVSLFDAVKVAKNNDTEPLYDEKQVDALLSLVKVIEYDQPFTIADLEITFRDAGHILGSAIIEIEDKNAGKKVVFSGDLGNYPQDIIKPTTFINKADFVVMESTYGDRSHPEENTIDIIKDEINAAELHKSTLLIPAFSIDRTQVLLHIINMLKSSGEVDYRTPVFLDSPMASRITTIYKSFHELYNQQFALEYKTEDPLDFPGLEIIENSHNGRKIERESGAKVILAGNGMMSGGKILNHAIEYLPRKYSRLLIVGYQADGTFGKQILDGVKNLVIENNQIKVRASVVEIKGLSAHADQHKLVKWLNHIQGIQHIALVHGEDEARSVLAEKIIHTNPSPQIHLPLPDDEVSF